MKPVRVLYSYPIKIGAGRICEIAWQQVCGLHGAGADLLVFPGVVHKPLPEGVKVHPTLSWGKLRISYKLVGSLRAFALHDFIVARRLEKLAGKIDIVHTWPSAALRTLEAAARLGIPTVLERPNAHTRFAYDIVQGECRKLGLSLPPNHEHAFKPDVLRREEAEFRLADRLLCPSDFVARTFIDEGYAAEKLALHQYGFDRNAFFPGTGSAESHDRGLSIIFVGGCAPRKGLHYGLDAWLRSGAHRRGTFSIVGEFVPGYAEKLAPMLTHPSVKVLGFRRDVPELMRKNDVLILPSIEEGSALVTSEARGSGCVLLVSKAAGAVCEHMKNALVHRVGDVETIREHIDLLDTDRGLLAKLRATSLGTVDEITWSAAGGRLYQVYREVINGIAGGRAAMAGKS